MMRVMIADDEKKVCQLIYNLVDWEILEMQVVGMSYSGFEALELAKKEKPDLMITDIRMPGYDGIELISLIKSVNMDIEFVIISGYKHFEYAQNAIKLGVEDYLLKPINKEELYETLRNIQRKYKLRKQKLTQDEKLQLSLQNSTYKLREGLMLQLLTHSLKPPYALEEINKNYCFQFNQGYFQMLILKIDYQGEGIQESKLINDKIDQVLKHLLEKNCLDMQSYTKECMTYCLLNYEVQKKKLIRKLIKNVIDELIVQGAVFEKLVFTIGMGSLVKGIKDIEESVKTAEIAIAERYVKGTGIVIDEVENRDNHESMVDMLIKLHKGLGDTIEILDVEAVKDKLLDFKKQVFSTSYLMGSEVLKLVEEAFINYLTLLRNAGLVIEEDEALKQKFYTKTYRCSSKEELCKCLEETIVESFEKVVEGKKREQTRPIRMAKQYIKMHYMEPISLDEVSYYVGFNASYFSSLFKKESGYNFLEYLSEVRMNEAKELLKESSLSVATICEKVGYNDLKHFTKTFKKNCGLKPTEYRKLYG